MQTPPRDRNDTDPCPEEVTMNGWLDDDGPYLTLPESVDDDDQDA